MKFIRLQIIFLFQEDPVQITEVRDDLRKECEKFGPVKKVIVFDVSCEIFNHIFRVYAIEVLGGRAKTTVECDIASKYLVCNGTISRRYASFAGPWKVK